MIFNSKQLEELENAHDSTGAFEEEGGDSESSGDESVDGGAMEWRRQLIEEASENVKRATTRPVDPGITYEIRSLLFDRETRRFGRVTASVPGYLKIDFLNGGDRELGILDATSYLKEVGAQKKLNELALQLGMTENEVLLELYTLGITPIDRDDDDEETEDVDDEGDSEDGDDPEAAIAAAMLAESAASKKKPKKSASKDAPAAKADAPAAPESKKPAAKKAPAAKKTAAAKSKKPASGKASGDPIDDPNAFIKANYEAQSNRELARVTGLSEHTIRRKLGEWGLKRKKK